MTPWSDSQRRMLAAMGYTPWQRASAASTTLPQVPASPARAEAGASAHPRLFAALRQAAAGADISALVGDLDALRRDPQRKRALWPKLRALRRPG